MKIYRRNSNMVQPRMLHHAAYLQTHRSQITASFLKAHRHGAGDPAVLLLDLADASARAILETTGRDDDIAAHSSVCRRRGFAPTITWGVPRTLAVALIAGAFPEVAQYVAVALDDGAFW